MGDSSSVVAPRGIDFQGTLMVARGADSLSGRLDGSVAKFGRSGELSASAGVRGWRMNDFKGRHFGGEIVLWAVRW